MPVNGVTGVSAGQCKACGGPDPQAGLEEAHHCGPFAGCPGGHGSVPQVRDLHIGNTLRGCVLQHLPECTKGDELLDVLPMRTSCLTSILDLSFGQSGLAAHCL